MSINVSAQSDTDSVAVGKAAQETQKADQVSAESVNKETTPSAAASSVKEKADQAYAAENYEEAARLYLSLTQNGENADVYYNLGNAYYRLDDIAHALLWYERALLLSPGDDDIRANLQLARTKTIDKIVPEEDIFFVRWYHSLLNTMSVNQWTWTGIVFFALMLIGLGLYFFAGQMRLRKVGFYGSAVLLLVVVMCNVFALQQRARQQERNGAIVMTEQVVVKSSPSATGSDLFLLHTGTSMQIIDKTMTDWYQIRLSDGKEGWIPTSAIEVI